MNRSEWTIAVDEILGRVEGLSLQEAGERENVSASTIRRWRELRDAGEEIPEPRGDVRNVLLRAIGREPEANGADNNVRSDYGTGLDGAGLVELYRRLDAIEASDMPEWLRVLKIDAVAGAIRAEAMRMAERATLERAAAIRDAEGAATERAKAAREEAQTARERVARLQPQTTAPVQSVGEYISDAEVEEHGQAPNQQPEPKKRVAGE